MSGLAPLLKVLNLSIRYGQALFTALKSFTPNKRFLNLNLFIGFFILVILFQSLVIKSIRSGSKNSNLVLLKGEVYSSNYDSLLKEISVNDLLKKPFKDRCNLYFDNLNSNDIKWKISDFKLDGHDDNSYTFDEFLTYYKHEHPNEEINDEKKDELDSIYREKYQTSKNVDNKIIDAISTLRIFSKCFIDNENKSKFSSSTLKSYWNYNDDDDNLSQDLCHDTEARVFPWLSNILPIYTRWDNEVSMGFPILTEESLEKINTDSSFPEYNVDKKKLIKRASQRENCFWKSFRNNINGKGYVISASDGQFDELKRLALILRVLGNKLPIQIIHKGDLSEKVQKDLIEAFRSNINKNNLKELYKNHNIDSYTAQNLNFPKQEVWFVDVQHSIKSEYLDHFKKYANKLLAYLFNSFEDMILIDTDTVPFVDLSDYIYNYPEYQKQGAYFFYDRQLGGTNFINSVNYFKRLLPSKLDTHFFDIPQVTDFTLKNRFIGYARNHFMESGVVAINRKRHFTGMLISVQLNFYGGINNGKIHGDKELFWLGLSSAGDESYTFNALGAASIGEITPKENSRLPESTSNELCSNHPGHIDGHDNHTLLWINSGMTYCKNRNFVKDDANKPLYKGRYDAEHLNELYASELKIRAAIIPPPQEIEASNIIGNPTRGWTDEHKYCGGYTWCAYDIIGDGSLEEFKGTLVEFNSLEYQWFDFIGRLWMEGLPEIAYKKENSIFDPSIENFGKEFDIDEEEEK